MSTDRIRVGVLGASGYTGADLVRLAMTHPNLEVALMTADRHAGKPMQAVFPHLGMANLQDLVTVAEADWNACDVAVCGLPHGTTQEIVAILPGHLKIADMSADFRLRNFGTYAEWYGHEHRAPHLQPEAVYGLTEYYRDAVAAARLVACPGCYPTAALLLLLPVVGAGLIDPADIVIDAKSGTSGAGRGLKEGTLFCEVAEGIHPYGVASHRHAPEIEQEVSLAAGREVLVNFTPHLMPMNRGELLTTYVRLSGGATAVGPARLPRGALCRTSPSSMSRRRAWRRRRAMSAARTMSCCRSMPTGCRAGRSWSRRSTIWSRARPARRSRTST